MTRIAYLDCASGIAGDMVLGALLDAGAPRTPLDHVVDALGLDGVSVEVTSAKRGAIVGTRVRVVTPESYDSPPGRPARELAGLVAGADLPAGVRDLAIDALRRLASAEGRIHGVDPDDAIMHELGGVDTLVDLCGAFSLLDSLGIDRVVCSPIPYARTITTGAHGSMPAPAPAVLELLRGAPMVGVASDVELVTPTGAAIAAVASQAYGELPPMTLDRLGYGTGERELPHRANVLRVVIGQPSLPPATAEPSLAPAATELVLLEANLDDLLPELVPDALKACTIAGALDVWTVPTTMKKGRPGIIVGAVARPADERGVAAALLEQTSTLGVRVTTLRRYELEREIREVRVEGYAIRVKIGLLDGRVVNVAPEHDDCASVASLTGSPAKRVWAAALTAAQDLGEPVTGARGSAR